jgi:hypothetical protein
VLCLWHVISLCHRKRQPLSSFFEPKCSFELLQVGRVHLFLVHNPKRICGSQPKRDKNFAPPLLLLRHAAAVVVAAACCCCYWCRCRCEGIKAALCRFLLVSLVHARDVRLPQAAVRRSITHVAFFFDRPVPWLRPVMITLKSALFFICVRCCCCCC